MRKAGRMRWRALELFALCAATCALGCHPSAALDKVKVGIPSTEPFSFMPVDFGNSLGIFPRNGVAVGQR